MPFQDKGERSCKARLSSSAHDTGYVESAVVWSRPRLPQCCRPGRESGVKDLVPQYEPICGDVEEVACCVEEKERAKKEVGHLVAVSSPLM